MDFCLQSIPLPLRFRPETPMSDDELMRFCERNDMLRFERDPNGDILVMTPAGNNTSKRNAFIGHRLAEWAERDATGYYFDSSAGFILPDGSMRSPDAAWIETSRHDALSAQDKDRFAPICPDFIIELRSPSDRLPDLQTKMEQWITNGAQFAWLIDPQTKSVTIYCPNYPPRRIEHPASIHGEGPVAGFELPLARIWS